MRKEEVEKISGIINGDTELLVKYAEELGKDLKNKELTTAQIQNVFGSVKKMEMQNLLMQLQNLEQKKE